MSPPPISPPPITPPPSVPQPSAPPSRIVHCTDALAWLAEQPPLAGCSLITSLPDVSGLPQLSLSEWKAWFINAAQLTLQATPEDGITIFYQTDIKRDGVWVDKAYLCQQSAERIGAELLWHKIVCRRAAGSPVFGRPGYTHLLCFSKGIKDHAAPYPDVLPSTGRMTWSQAMGTKACELACRYVLSHTTSRTIVDPFCGVGTVLAVANEMGLNAVGVEIAQKRAKRARSLVLPAAGPGENAVKAEKTETPD